METKQLQATEVKLLDEGHGEISGYASTYDWDSVKERVVPGAFGPHLAAFLKDGFVAAGHDWLEPIGVPLEAYEDERGLFVRAALHNTPRAQTVREIIRDRMKHQKAVKLSIGYEVLADEYIEEGRLLKEIKLHEWSYVAVPANPAAIVLGAKGQTVSELSLESHFRLVVSAAEELMERMRANGDIRAKDGRPLSDANRERLAALVESHSKLLKASEPKATREETAKLFRQTMEVQARLRALGVY